MWLNYCFVSVFIVKRRYSYTVDGASTGSTLNGKCRVVVLYYDWLLTRRQAQPTVVTTQVAMTAEAELL